MKFFHFFQFLDHDAFFLQTMSNVTKRQGKTIIPQFEKTIKSIATLLTNKVYLFIEYSAGIEKQEEKKKAEKAEEKKSTNKKRKRKDGDEDAPPREAAFKMPGRIKNAQFIPTLVFSIENYSQMVLGLSKRTKTDLSFGFKPYATRDFKIKELPVIICFFNIFSGCIWLKN